jgi:hypothetical protein
MHKSKKSERVVAFPIQLISYSIFQKPFKELNKDSKNTVLNVWNDYQRKFYEKSYKKYGSQEKLW